MPRVSSRLLQRTGVLGAPGEPPRALQLQPLPETFSQHEPGVYLAFDSCFNISGGLFEEIIHDTSEPSQSQPRLKL